MAVDDGGERGCQIGLRLDSVEFAGLDEGGDSRPVLCSSVMPNKEGILAIESYRSHGPLDAVFVDLDAAVGPEELEATPEFSDVGQSLSKRGLRRDTGAVVEKPGLHVGDYWR